MALRSHHNACLQGNKELSFYLPFKLHGSRSGKTQAVEALQFDDDDSLEREFLSMFDCAQENTFSMTSGGNGRRRDPERESSHSSAERKSSHQQEIRTEWRVQSMEKRRPTSLIESNTRRAIPSRTPSDKNNKTPGLRKSEDDATERYVEKVPDQLKLGNVGQVKALAASFDSSRNRSSAPSTPSSRAPPPLTPLARRHYDTPQTSVSRPIPAYQKKLLAPYSSSTRIPTKPITSIPTANKNNRCSPLSLTPSPAASRKSEAYETLSLPKTTEHSFAAVVIARPTLSSPTHDGRKGAESQTSRPIELRRRKFLFGHGVEREAAAGKTSPKPETEGGKERQLGQREPKRNSWIQKFRTKKH